MLHGCGAGEALFMFGVSRSILFAGAAHPSLQSGFGVGVRRWPVGAATTEMLMLKRNAAICERRASAPKSDCPPPLLPHLRVALAHHSGKRYTHRYSFL